MPRERNRRILFISGIGLGQRAAQLLSTLITLPLVLHALGLAGFGIWGAATSLAWLSSMLDLGLGSALLSLLPQAKAAGQSAALHRYITASLCIAACLSLLVLGGGAALWLGGQHLLSAPFLAAVILLALNIPLNISRDIWFGLHKGYIAGYWDFAQTLLTLALLLLAAWWGGGITIMTIAVYAAMLAINAASLAHALLRHPELRPRAPPAIAALREILTRGSLLFAITIAASCAYSFDTLLALHWRGAAAAAQMVIAMRVCTTAIGFLNIITQPLWPEFVEAAAEGDLLWLKKILRHGTLLTSALAIAGSALIVAFGAPVLRWWLHQDMHITQAFLWVMAAWIIALNLPRIAGLYLNAVSELKFQIYLLTAAALLGFILKYFAVKSFGAAGILAATPILWLLIVAPAYFWLAWGRVQRGN
ncbi:hypothetical protein GCM10010909_19970 [Acidocella aquatica]|uniref:O-antigen/teichoic acid export membrane protein n=1 Tax=Acidocella aquatica TaxID=1922313 RepID=A0ABQ6A636_9PROT|nr:hypothetical protein [Acidocella aquatica]GLR67316.1 hypothetical protein GCM10010909_19970 [Acidocella aquatica]